jgi:hypothetical protein
MGIAAGAGRLVRHGNWCGIHSLCLMVDVKVVSRRATPLVMVVGSWVVEANEEARIWTR